MALPHLFQDFGTLKVGVVAKRSMTADEIEDLKLQAFDSGFQAGWDDAVKAQAEMRTHISAELATSLQTASFEYHEVHATLNASAQRIIQTIIDTILPVVAQASLGAQIRDAVVSALHTITDCQIEIVLSPMNEVAVRQILSAELQDPFKLVSDPKMPLNQATLRLGAQEAEINLDKMVADIASAVNTFFENQKSEGINGRSA
jgi:flagellar biosynthesis/type III secretory pathway protein FliH